MNSPSELLERIYQKAMQLAGSDNKIKSQLPPDITRYLDEILKRSESSKAVLTVLLTSLVYKILHPDQDIRMHQTSIQGGYSGRTYDTKYITPFLKSKSFPAMAESGWLTRSLEQKVPYNLEYSGAIRPNSLKTAFLAIVKSVQEQDFDLGEILTYLVQGLIIIRNKQEIDLAKPCNLPISTIVQLLIKHFDFWYTTEGASRLPVLALYAAYQCLMNEVGRFQGKKLLALESHTSADSRSGRIGDIDILDEQGRYFEAVEVKHRIPTTVQMVKDAFEKLKTTQVKRYYLLSTASTDQLERAEIDQEIDRAKNIHGVQLIVNGVIPSLKYYLRLLSDTSEFIENYVNLVEKDNSIKFVHKKQWNAIISEM